MLQVLYLAWNGNGLGKLSDSFSEADVLRSAEAYATGGLFSHHGLPRVLYGLRFPGAGSVIDHIDTNGLVPVRFRTGFPDRLASRDEWVYTHYPPASNMACGLMARLFGVESIWKLRLLPVGLGLAATALFFCALARAFGAGRAAFIAIGCALLPMYSTYMPGLHYEGYSFALLLLQLSLLINLLWQPGAPRLWPWATLFLFGFLQGWLSFDMFFIVSLVPAPLWLLRRAERAQPSARWLCLAVALPCIGFGLAHLLHLVQVAAELGGLGPAIAELGHTAAERAGYGGSVTLPQVLQHLGFNPNPEHFGFLSCLLLSGYYYVREVLIMRSYHFGPFFLLALLATLPVLFFNTTQLAVVTLGRQRRLSASLGWPGPKRAWLALGAALLVSLMWCLFMPAHVVGNRHITVRHLFVLYFLLLLVLARSISFRSESLAQPAGGSAG